MISTRFLGRKEWERELRRYGCIPMTNLPRLTTVEFWEMPWHPKVLTVPTEADGRMTLRDFDDITAYIGRTAPDGTEFPPDD